MFQALSEKGSDVVYLSLAAGQRLPLLFVAVQFAQRSQKHPQDAQSPRNFVESLHRDELLIGLIRHNTLNLMFELLAQFLRNLVILQNIRVLLHNDAGEVGYWYAVPGLADQLFVALARHELLAHEPERVLILDQTFEHVQLARSQHLRVAAVDLKKRGGCTASLQSHRLVVANLREVG